MGESTPGRERWRLARRSDGSVIANGRPLDGGRFYGWWLPPEPGKRRRTHVALVPVRPAQERPPRPLEAPC